MNAYILKSANKYAKYAHLAYAPPHVLLANLTEWQNKRFWSHGLSEGFVVWNNTRGIVSIRGSDEIGDWLRNINVSYGKLNDYDVHSGFLEHATEVVDHLKNALVPSNIKLTATGHSLGGAAATILPLLWNIEKVYTFGSPRCFSPKSANKFTNTPIYRFVRCCDPVPDLPRRYWLLFKYSHVGYPIHMISRGVIGGEGCGIGSGIYRKMKHTFNLWRGHFSDIAKDHSMELYKEWLEPFA